MCVHVKCVPGCMGGGQRTTAAINQFHQRGSELRVRLAGLLAGIPHGSILTG